VIATFERGIFPDGIAFDDEGGVWVVSIFSNSVIRVAPDGASGLVLSDADAEEVTSIEEAFSNATLGRQHMDAVPKGRLRNISSLAFGGPGRRTGLLGSLSGDGIETFQTSFRGTPPAHWQYDIRRTLAATRA
jgi:hypothetical protein